MSLRRRLYDVARGELRSAAGRARAAAGGLFGPGAQGSEELGAEAARPRTAPGDAVSAEDGRGTERPGASPSGAPEHIRRYYANLELPLGAGPREVKAAYRRLMRRYHPDLHRGDVEKARAATELTRALRAAYEGLLAYLEPGGR